MKRHPGFEQARGVGGAGRMVGGRGHGGKDGPGAGKAQGAIRVGRPSRREIVVDFIDFPGMGRGISKISEGEVAQFRHEAACC